MFKCLIFFTLILFIKNEFTETEKEYLQSVNTLTTSTRTNIIEDFKERYNKLIEINFFNPSLKEQLYNIGFSEIEKDELIIKEHENENEAKKAIKAYIEEKNFRKYGNDKLGKVFTEKMKYQKQWSKYDLLYCKGNKIKSLSILTKKIDKEKYATIYFSTFDRIFYEYGEFVLINNSINEDNPFNDIYSMTHLKLICNYRDCQIKSPIIDILLYKNILIRYYSILSYNAIAQAIPANFNKPF
jgi:hypothetical protein